MESVATDAALRQTHRCTSRTEKEFAEFCEEFAREVDRVILVKYAASSATI
jgi:hypothetical protein